MKRIISAVILITMLLSTVMMAIPASAATAVTDATTFNAALKAAEGDTTITIGSGVTVTPTSLTWPTKDATVTVTGGGKLDLSKIATINMGCGLVLDGVSVVFQSGGTVYAEGHPLTIKSNVTVSYAKSDGTAVTGTSIAMTVYGGSNSNIITGDTYLNIQSGIYTCIFGGSNGKALTGNTNVTIGTEGAVNNDTLVGWSDETHGSTYQFFGGNNGGMISGNTNLTVGSNAYADYVVGGNNGGGRITGCANMWFSGYAYGLYGGSRGGNTMNDVNLVMLGGGVCDIVGASSSYGLGNADDPSNVYVKLFGGQVKRRVYAGSYNDIENVSAEDSVYVYGTCTVILGSGVNLSFDYKKYSIVNISEGLYTSSRSNGTSDTEKGVVILIGGANSDKVGSCGTSYSYGVNPSTRHNMSYSASGNTLTETCSCGCGHSDTVKINLKYDKTEYLYTGSPIDCASLVYGDGWMSGPVDSHGYANDDNVTVGIHTYSASVNLAGSYNISTAFEILESEGFEPGAPDDDYNQSGSIDVSYTVAQTYIFNIPESVALAGVKQVAGEGATAEEIAEIEAANAANTVTATITASKVILDVQNVFKIYVSSANGFKLVNKSGDKSVGYEMTYGDATVTEGTHNIHLMTIRWKDALELESCDLKFIRTGDADSGSFSDILTFSAESIYDEIPPLVKDTEGNEMEFDTDVYDVGDGSNLYVKTQVADTYEEGVEIFDNYVAELQANGYSLYTTNKIDENHFATLQTPSQIVNVMYIDHYKDLRIVTDLKSEFDLPGLAIENSYKTWAEYTPNLTLISGQDIRWPGRMGYIYQLDDGSFFIIDGGYMKANNKNKVSATDFTTGYDVASKMPNANYDSAAPYMIEIMEKYAPDPNNIVIAAWFITHTHEDHMGAFVDISLLAEFKDFKDKVTIEQFIYNKSSDYSVAHLNSLYGDQTNSLYHAAYQAAIDSWSEDQMLSKVKAHPGQVFYIRNLEMTVFTSQDLLHNAEHYIEGNTYDPFTTGGGASGSNSNKYKYINNTSVVVMINFLGKNTLYLGDSSAGANPYVVAPLYEKALGETQILQVAHHGYSDTAADSTYKAIVAGGNLEVIFWPTNSNHFYGSSTPAGYEDALDGSTHNALGIAFNQQLFAAADKTYVHGQDNITITNFDTYEPDELANRYQKFDKDTWIEGLEQ